MKGLASQFIELFTRTSTFEKRVGIHNNGIENNYPELVVSRIENSVTATRCKNTMATFLSGKGFGDELNKIVINKFKNITLLQFTQDIAESLAEQGGVYIHINYNGDYSHRSYEVLPFTDCRVGKKDDDDNTGKILYCKDWSDNKLAKDAKKIDVYNANETVLQKQIEKADGIQKYNGQILFFKFGKYTYPLAPIHPSLDDADSEKQASIYKNVSLRKGFFGKTLVITRPLIGTDLSEDSNNEIEAEDYRQQSEARDSFRDTIQQFVGAENVDGVMHMEMEFETDKLEESIMFKNIESNIDDKLFAHTEETVSDNICMAFGIPPMLVRNTESALFGASGEAIREMKKFYQDQTNDERMRLEQIVGDLMKNFESPLENLKIIPIINIEEKKKVEKDPDEARKQAQATLKGSVGGVTALLQIQLSVSEGKTKRDAALTIIEEIYGIDRELAGEMLGTPEIENTI